ncbi:serine hydrolase [Bacillus sp. 0102A]|uniref:serine hydrolase n=1 Tax=Bacillus sp. 0102A TaxID=3120563 RepID=UPI002FDA1376
MKNLKKSPTTAKTILLHILQSQKKHVDTGMSLKEISEAAIRYSDNTAGNILLQQLGGPKGFEKSLKQIGIM